MRALVLSAYDAQSHCYWHQGLIHNFPEIEWQLLSLPPRYFSWRIRGNSLFWAIDRRETLIQAYDFILATSMVDLSTLIGLCPELARVPTILYFHENQFTYPLSGSQHKSIEPAMVNLYSALAATVVYFNSAFNRSSFLDGVEKALSRFPDFVPDGVVQILADKSQVLCVPLMNSAFTAIDAEAITGQLLREDIKNEKLERVKSHMEIRGTDFRNTELLVPKSLSTESLDTEKPYEILWNHRWEYDKGPDRLLAYIKALPSDLPLLFHIVGQSFARIPPEFDQIKNLLVQRGWLGEWSYVSLDSDYCRLLSRADAVLSTAVHDFQGLSVLEAVAAGCVPIVPDRLAYIEYIDASYRYESCDADEDEFTQETLSAVKLCIKLMSFRKTALNIQAYSWDAQKQNYAAAFEHAIKRFKSEKSSV
ncbi:MAG: glycosyltransferase involved in cell wall biosynthesis [Flavobacteriales bacterium]|jgi:glycosyltransferase involved in cell wall biosynthesis